MLDLYNKLVESHKASEGAKAEEEIYKTKLMELLGDSPAFLSTENGKVKKICYWSSTNRTSFDTDALQKDHPEINLEDYKRVSQSASFRISYPRESK